MHKEKISGIQTTEVLLARMLFTMDYAEELSKNFRSVVDSVGQHAAGDEKPRILHDPQGWRRR